MRATLALLVLLGVTGCLRKTEFKCTSATDCSAYGSICESNGYCSFIDMNCASGHRYGDLSGDNAGECTAGMPDAGVDALLLDATAGNCPMNYGPINGAPGHVYRHILTPAAWTTQKNTCATDGANVYLAVPNDGVELMAIVTGSTDARLWIGIDDQATEGTYVTTRGGTIPANDPMWAPGEPNNMPVVGGGQADCVVGQEPNEKLADELCTRTYPAMCECEP